MKRGACAFDAPDTGKSIYSWSQMKLNATTLFYLDAWYHKDGRMYYEISKNRYVFNKKSKP